ncbi:ABC transporter ATP-binding protein [Asticcacaulis sp.]|uniref:ABC transporter ATP-binding protein n=1 Tax=Asticcacaulis sp. TaxID=1872648 RepID=UPI002B7B90BE|nr:ABC transporter ATP-binding protein [Asticcacaulis sp.]HTM80981.1 ABC transporter ATP-binding protein [Asticcacaulis sp.]
MQDMSLINALYSRFERMIDPFGPHEDGPPPDKLLPFFWQYLKQAWPLFLAILIAGFLYTITEVAVFRFMADIVDYLTYTKPGDLWRTHGADFMRMAVIIGIVWPVIGFIHSLFLRQAITSNFPNLIRWQSHRHVVRQSIGFFTNDYAGRVASKVVETASAVRNTLTTLCDTLLYVVIYFGSAIVLFFQADWRLVIPLLVWSVVYGLACAWFVPKLGVAASEGAEARSALVGRIVDTYTNIQTVKLFAGTRHEDDYVREGLLTNCQKWQVQERLITGLDTSTAFINSVLLLVMATLAIWLWSQGLITVGAIALVGALTQRLISMSNWVMFQVTSLFENIGSVQNGIETISRPHTVVDSAKAPPLEVRQGEVRFDHVGFSYGDLPAIQDFTLTIAAGEKIGLVGPSGAGKSTLVNLFLRLYDLKSGRILIDGQDIAHVGQESLRAHIGMVTQDTSLLHRSIRDNIAYGSPGATDAEIERAAARAHAQGFIPDLNDGQGRSGYDAHVGERGVKLSGGQRQRIAIARVLLKNAPILVLDEATSALDSEVEAAIQESLLELMAGKTVIAIAHRLSTIARMDRLVVIDGGRIIETGTHDELIAAGGLYARLWARQTGGFLAEAVA